MYATKPKNFNEIKEIFIRDVNEINKILLKEQTIIFYDTCSLGNHARENPITKNYDVLDYFTNNDTVIITDKILEEMINTTTGEVSFQYIQYLKALVRKIKFLVLLNECEIENLLNFKMDKEVSRKKIVDIIKLSFLQLAPPIQKKLINTIDLKDKEFLKTILSSVDFAKRNRGEISISICMFSIENIRKKNFRILTDDKNSIQYLLKPFEEKKAMSNVSIESTSKIVQILYNQFSNWTEKSKSDIVRILNVIRTDEEFKILYKDIVDGIKYQNLVEAKLSNNELAEKIFNKSIAVFF